MTEVGRYKHETRKCLNCNEPFEVRTVNKNTGKTARGSTRVYCCNACKQEAYLVRLMDKRKEMSVRMGQ